MKKLILSFCSIVLSIALCASNEKEIPSEIKNVTLYRQGAQISREGSSFLRKGKTTLLFEGLPAAIDPESIQAKASDNVMIISVTHNINYLNKAIVSTEIKALNERRRVLVDTIKVINNYKTVYAQEKEMILSNKSIAGDNGVSISELQQAADFFRRRLTEIESSTHRLDNVLFGLKNDLVNISKQLLELNAKIDLPTSQVTVVVSSETDVKTTMQLEYFIEDAGWSPAYDVRIKDVNAPLCLFYKAKVFQNTGEAWDNVNLTLSTGNPSLSNNKPELAAYFLTFDNYYLKRSDVPYASNQPFKGHVSGKVTDAQTGETLPGAIIIVKGTITGTVADIDGNYQIDLPAGANMLDVSFLGYKTQEINVNSPSINVTLAPDLASLDEVVVIGYGTSGDDYESTGSVSGYAPEKKKVQIPLAIEKSRLTTEFHIDTPYSIPSDNQPYDVTMIEYDIDASYKYLAVPKLSPDAYLIASIPDFIKYDLLAGTANIFFKGIYQGESFIDPGTSGDTLTLSIGRDNDIIIMRESQKDFTGRSFTGVSKKEQKAWTITVKNNKDVPVEITLEDQYPVSKISDIKVDLIEDSDAKADKSTGKLTWDLMMSPKEKKTIDLKYTVRYPSGRQVIVD
jgi:hypothetical protein